MQRFRRSIALVALLSACSGGENLPQPGRIVLISMDTVRADRVSGYGDADTTPNLAAIAASGVLFRHCYAASNYTIPSHMTIFTGLDPAEHGVITKAARLSPDVPTIAELLSRQGWRTAAFHEGGYVEGRFGFDRGFDEYSGHARVAVVDDDLDEVLDWIRTADDDPYFLFVHTYAAHFPYGGYERYRDEVPERGLLDDEEIRSLRQRAAVDRLAGASLETRLHAVLYNHLARSHGQFIRVGGHNRFPSQYLESEHLEADMAAMLASYDERIRLIDAAIGAIRHTLEERGQWEDTLLVVLSDHGESFFEHGLQRHDYVPFEEALRVPLVVSWPRVLATRPHIVEELVWHLDLFPTILRLAGIPAPFERRGRDLTSTLLGDETLPAERAVFPAVLRPAHLRQKPLRRVVVRGREKFIQGHDWFGDAEGLLFDLAADPGETRNLRTQRPDLAADMARASASWERALRPVAPAHQVTGEPLGPNAGSAPAVDISPEKLDQLRELGYVGAD